MAAFLQSGHSVSPRQSKLNGCYRPRAEVIVQIGRPGQLGPDRKKTAPEGAEIKSLIANYLVFFLTLNSSDRVSRNATIASSSASVSPRLPSSVEFSFAATSGVGQQFI